MATQTQSQPAPVPEITIITRVASIPLVASSLSAVHSTLTNNTYTRGSYAQAQGISKAALSFSEPIQKTFAPLIVRADGIANMGLDAVESRYPYPFKTPTEDIMKDLKGRTDSAYDMANKTIDERVRSPALHVAQGIDQVSDVHALPFFRITELNMSFTELRACCRLLPSCRTEDPLDCRYP